MYTEKDAIEQGVNDAEKEKYSSRGEIDTADKTSREIQRNREIADALLLELQNKLNETKLNLSSVKERLSVEFNIDLDALMEEENQEEQPEDAKSELSEQELREQ